TCWSIFTSRRAPKPIDLPSKIACFRRRMPRSTWLGLGTLGSVFASRTLVEPFSLESSLSLTSSKIPEEQGDFTKIEYDLLTKGYSRQRRRCTQFSSGNTMVICEHNLAWRQDEFHAFSLRIRPSQQLMMEVLGVRR